MATRTRSSRRNTVKQKQKQTIPLPSPRQNNTRVYHLPHSHCANTLDTLPEMIKKIAMEWYEKGIQRGLKKATDMMAENAIYKENGVLHAPTSIQVCVKTRLNGESWEHRIIEITAEDIGFER